MSNPLTQRRRYPKESQQSESTRSSQQWMSTQSGASYTESNVSAGNVTFYSIQPQAQQNGQPGIVPSQWEIPQDASLTAQQHQQDIWKGNSTYMPSQNVATQPSSIDPWNWDIDGSQGNLTVQQQSGLQQNWHYENFQQQQKSSHEHVPVQTTVQNPWMDVNPVQPSLQNANQQQKWNYQQQNYFSGSSNNNNLYNWQVEQQPYVNQQWYGHQQSLINQSSSSNQKETPQVDQYTPYFNSGWENQWTGGTNIEPVAHQMSVQSDDSDLKSGSKPYQESAENATFTDGDKNELQISDNSVNSKNCYSEISSNRNNSGGDNFITNALDCNSGLSAFFNNDSNYVECLVPTSSSSLVVTSDQTDNSSCKEDQKLCTEKEIIGQMGENSQIIQDENLLEIKDFDTLPKEDKSTGNSTDIHLVQHEMENLSLNSELKQPEIFLVEEPVNQEVPEPTVNTSQTEATASLQLTDVGDNTVQENTASNYQNTEEPINQQVPDTVPAFSSNQSNLNLSRSNSTDMIHQQRGIIIKPREGSPFKPPSKQSAIPGNVVVQQELEQNATETTISAPTSTVQEVNLETVPENLEQPPDGELSHHSSWHASLHRHQRDQRCNNSPSTTLWDSPDVPSVTFLPAAPLFPNQNEGIEKPLQDDQLDVTDSSLESNPNAVPRQSPLGWEGSQPEVKMLKSVANSLPTSSIGHQSVTDTSVQLNSDISVPSPPPPPTVAMELLQRASPQGAGHIHQQTQPASHPLVPAEVSCSQYDSDHRNNSQMNETGRSRYDDLVVPPERQNRQEIERFPGQRIISGQGSMSDREEMSHDRREELSQRRDSLPNYQMSNNQQSWDRGYRESKRYNEDERRRAHYSSEADHLNRSDTWDRRSDGRHYPDDKRYSSLDERDYLSERDRSRPSSRTSLNESIDGHDRYYRERDYRRMYYDRVRTTPNSELDRGNWSNDRKYYRSSGYEQEMGYGDRYSQYRRNDDVYQKAAYRGYNYDLYRQDPRAYYQYYDSLYNRYGYSNYNYGYYDELYRNDPRYRTQVDERYQEYYNQLSREQDYERVSVHSGRSSVNDELQRNRRNKYSGDVDQSSIGGSDYSGYNQNVQQQYESSYSTDFTDSTRLNEREQSMPARLTPTKFSCPHSVVSFTRGGLLLTVFPNVSVTSQPSAVQIHNVQELIASEESIKELQSFPGPLLRGRTHKNDIIHFCQKKIQQLKQREVADRESCILLWELMIRLLRQNGCVAGTDVSELLLNNHEVLKPLTKRSSDTSHGDGTLSDAGESTRHLSSGDTPSPDEGIVVTHDRTILNANTTESLTVEKVTQKFREFLLFGGKQDALEWAMKHNLWGHALFLASKMDSHNYANVMKRFANSLTANDPLQTLYQLMSGRQPASVTRIAEEKWGDWRPHLAMILSNPSARTEVDLRSITTLGDTLASLGCLSAAHFCYLMAQVEFGSFSNKSSKLVLLSSSNILPFQSFASNEAIQCTEIYEYAQTLANPEYILPHLQAYKFIYATRLVEYGFPQEALHYCEVISHTFHKLAGCISPDLVNQVYELANKLKYHDPHFTQGQGELEELGNPDWLVNLQKLCNYMNGYGQTEEWNEVGTATDSKPKDVLDPSFQISTNASEVAPSNVNYSDLQNYAVQQQQYQNYAWNNQGVIPSQNEIQTSNVQDYNQNQITGGPQYHSNISQWNPENISSKDKTEHVESVEGGSTGFSLSSTQHSFDYYAASTQQVPAVSTLTSRERTNSTGSTVTTAWSRRDSLLSSGSNHSAGFQNTVNQSTRESHLDKSTVDGSKKVEKKDNKEKSQVGRSWLGGIFSKFLPKAPNQMILPDDKNPAIVWDPLKNRWVNTDEDEDDDSGKFVAPPKDSELMKNANEDPNSQGYTPPLGQNKFQRPKVRGMRQNYVDVFNTTATRPNSAPAPEISYPNFDPNATPAILVPHQVPDTEMETPELVSQSQAPSVPPPPPLFPENPPQTGKITKDSGFTPMMFDPAEFNTSRNGSNLQRPGMGKLARRAFLT